MDCDCVCLSVDVEWAHPAVLAHVVRLLDERSLRATFFCTHAGVAVPGHERALHPNFRRRGDTMHRLREALGPQAETAEEAEVYDFVVSATRRFCPEATGSRSHSLFYDSQLLPILRRHGVEYDSSCFLPGASGLQPVLKEHDVLELPICYMDHHDLVVGRTDFRLDRLGLDRPGLKVFDFHPNLVLLNAATEDDYARTKPFYHDYDRLAAARHPGRGVGSLFEELLDHLARRRQPMPTLGEINRTWRQVHETTRPTLAGASPVTHPG